MRKSAVTAINSTDGLDRLRTGTVAGVASGKSLFLEVLTETNAVTPLNALAKIANIAAPQQILPK